MSTSVRGYVQELLWKTWAGEAGALGAALSPALTAAALVFRGAVAVRNRGYDRREAVRVDGLGVVSVGNLALGGTGKTPLSAWAVRQLAAAGEQPALLTRGYGRDEPLLHARWNPGAPVVVGADRVAAARRAAHQGATAAVLDDGFQHRRLHRDVDLVLLAAEDPFPGHVLPRGPYREPPPALARAHAVIVTRRGADAHRADSLAGAVRRSHPHLAVARVHLAAGAWQDLEGGPADAPRGPVLAATGIARPAAFAALVRARLGEAVELAAFADHHEFDAEDVEALVARAAGRTIVVTEKDAVKLTQLPSPIPRARVLTQDVRWEEGEDVIRRLVLDAGKGAPRP